MGELPCPDTAPVPLELQAIPYAEDTCIVLDSKRIQFDNIPCTFNASIVNHNDGYIIVFRQDIKPLNSPRTAIKTGFAHFDQQLHPVSNPSFYDTIHQTAHDARIFSFDNELYLLYTYIFLGDTPFTKWNPLTAPMRQALAKLDSNGKPYQVTELNYGSNLREKNWTPFEYKDSTGAAHLYFIYTFNPLEIISFDSTGSVNPIVTPSNKVESLNSLWERQWGPIRGGTQALLLDNEYIAIFHSCFILENKLKCYVFGALTFEKEYPFRITKISPYPIITRDFYTTIDCECWKHRLVKKNVMFPCGLAKGQKNGRDVLYLTSGENDHIIKLITLDTENLLKSMITIKE